MVMEDLKIRANRLDNINTYFLLINGNDMPEIIVKYKNKRTLEALRDFAKYFDYVISSPDSKRKKAKPNIVNGVTIIPADNSINVSELTAIFTGKDVSSSQLRNDAWQRKK